ncbi:thioredoxin domain-containing protein 17-like [Condylostylus longicornis]|uniref:thioredoxin domain-containing protein 17-like n=1 Tax=Condylostylus longicornis TaxID=2530218 RepID=UPI00244DDD75|nr:thioredoxin domain-containing protein 17-like [Condylostylus longicornis]
MENIEKLSGYNEFRNYADNIKSGNVNFYFTGSKNESGVSWCPDCVEALPHVEEAFEKYQNNCTLISVDVGDRAYWKDMSNPFRLDKDIKLMVIPTLIRWKKPQRLEGDQCAKKDLLQMFFSDEED